MDTGMDKDMKIDIRPLCDKHLIVMELVKVQAKMPGSDVWEWPAFRCSEPSCSRLLESRGYLALIDGMADPVGRNRIDCDTDGQMMFIEKVEGDHLIWRCSKEGCRETKRVRCTV